MIRSARSISPPLASSPNDSAFARWYEITELSAITANGSIDMCGESCDARYQATPPNNVASVTRSTTESKNAPRWLDEFDALASAPSNRSGKRGEDRPAPSPS